MAQGHIILSPLSLIIFRGLTAIRPSWKYNSSESVKGSILGLQTTKKLSTRGAFIIHIYLPPCALSTAMSVSENQVMAQPARLLTTHHNSLVRSGYEDKKTPLFIVASLVPLITRGDCELG